MLRALVLASLSFAAGLLVGWFVFAGEPPAPTAPPIPRAAAPTAPAPAPARLEGVPASPLDLPPTTPTAASPAPEAVASPTAKARVAALAEQLRRRGQATIDAAETSARKEVARAIAAEMAAREDLERGGTMAFLRRLKGKWVAPYELLGSPKEYAALFERKAKGAHLDGPTLRPEKDLGDGATILFPPGKHALDARVLNQLPSFPKDVSIEGYGMDETLLVLNTELRLRGDVHSLTFRDLTIDCSNNYLEAMRSGAYTLRVDNCRIIGFDMGAGGSCMLGGSVGAFYASNSRIEAGYGRSPGFGNLFDVRGALLARLEDCVVVGPFQSVYYQWSGAAQLFERCRFEAMPPWMRKKQERHGAEVQFKDCTFDDLPEDAPPSPKQRPVTDINPTWK